MNACVHVDLGDGVIRLMETSKLAYRETKTEDNREKTVVTEYLLNGKVVHRSAHVTLKEGIGIEGVLGRIG